MNILNWIAAVCAAGRSYFVCEVALKMLAIKVFQKNRKQNYTPLNEILLYGSESEEHVKEIGLNNLLCIYYVILHARKSVEVCVPSLVSDTLVKCLINVHQKNKVKIKIAIHNSDNFHNLLLLARNGIEVKIIKPVVRLEYEFLLIDALNECKDGVVVMGSLDYETSRVNCNRDATVITSENAVVTALKREFDRVWNSVSDIECINDKLK